MVASVLVARRELESVIILHQKLAVVDVQDLVKSQQAVKLGHVQVLTSMCLYMHSLKIIQDKF